MSDNLIIPIAGNPYGYTEITIDSDGKMSYQNHEDVSDILKINATQRNDLPDQYMGKGTQTSMKKIGTISQGQMQQLIEQGIFWDDEKLLQWFKNLDNYLWRTTNKV